MDTLLGANSKWIGGRTRSLTTGRGGGTLGGFSSIGGAGFSHGNARKLSCAHLIHFVFHGESVGSSTPTAARPQCLRPTGIQDQIRVMSATLAEQDTLSEPRDLLVHLPHNLS